MLRCARHFGESIYPTVTGYFVTHPLREFEIGF